MPLAAWFTLPGFAEIIRSASFDTIKFTMLLGLLWGLGGLPYGIAVRYFGTSLGNSVVLGLCSAFGDLC
jgi:L-rhamnose-H+ transport protein